MGYRVAVVGATGNVGREMLAILVEREFPMDEVAAVASSRSQGLEVEIGAPAAGHGPAAQRRVGVQDDDARHVHTPGVLAGG